MNCNTSYNSLHCVNTSSDILHVKYCLKRAWFVLFCHMKPAKFESILLYELLVCVIAQYVECTCLIITEHLSLPYGCHLQGCHERIKLLKAVIAQ